MQEGDNSHGRNICGKCCVEVGREGRVWCLGCYEDDEHPEVYAVGMTKKELQVQSVGRIADWLSGCGEEQEDANIQSY